MVGRIFLGGGGDEADEALLWDEAFGSGQHVTVWPFARRDPREREEVGRWFSAALTARGSFSIDVWLGDESDAGALDGCDVLAIPGGNTFDLLAHLVSRGRLQTLRDFHARGGHLYGGSAGAVLMGTDISPASGANRNEAGLSDLRALDLLGGALVRPHYEPGLRATLQASADSHGATIWAVPERGGVVVDGCTARASGPDPVHVFTPGTNQEFEQGETWLLPANRRCGRL
jgi:dipeptidase E